MMSLICCLSLFCFSRQTNANELTDALDIMYTAKIDPATARTVTNLTINHTGATFNLKNGTIVFFQPITLDGKQQYWGGYFVGEGDFRFAPPIRMERDQLQRFFKKDSLSGTFTETALLFSDSIYNLIQAHSTSTDPVVQTVADRGNDYRGDFTRDENREFIFAALKSFTEPAKEPFLLAALRPKEVGYIWYYFNPFDREEVRFYKEYKHLSGNVMEMVCSYSQLVDSTLVMLNGASKDDVTENHFDIDATITREGMFTGIVTASYTIAKDSLCMFKVDLNPELSIDSITTEPGKQISYRRTKDKNYQRLNVYILLDDKQTVNGSLKLTFYYSGKIAESVVNIFYISAMYGWYPEYGWRQRATYTMNFHSPKGIEFVATGTPADRIEKDNILHTKWELTEPASDASFSIGFMKKYQFTDEVAGTVDVYYDEELSRLFAEYFAAQNDEIVKIGAHMEKQVGEDLVNAIRLFSHRFGKRAVNSLSASEIAAWHGQSFPGFLHLSAITWMTTDSHGRQRLFRAHEVAHQWWGTGVSYSNYHDQWLSEGFAEYSALMYVQAVEGNDQFLDILKKYRKDIFGNRKFLIGEAEEEGPIAMGYRTQSSKAVGGAHSLIIYKKGAIVLHMLRNLFLDLNTMSEDAFFDMMKEWYATYQGKPATTIDFKRLTEKYVGVDMSWFFDQWVYGTELPTYTFSYEIQPDSNNTYKAVCTVLSEGVNDKFITDVPVQIQIDKDRSAYIRVAVSGKKTEFTIPGLPQKPQKIIFNVFESILAEVKQ